MAVKFVVDFYKVTWPSGVSSLGDLIKADAKSKDDETRSVVIHGYPIRLQEAKATGEIIQGDLLRIQMNDLPPKAKRSGKVQSLGLDADEGIGGETAFLFNEKLSILAIHRNRTGVSAKTFIEYFESKSGIPETNALSPVIQGDAMKRLASMKEVRHLTIRLAGITNPSFLKSPDSACEHFLDVMKDLKAPNATFDLSMGRESGSLVMRKVIEVAKHLTSVAIGGGGEAKKIDVTGILTDDTKDQFDLLLYRMVETSTLMESNRRLVSYPTRKAEVMKAWSKRKAELEEMLG